MKICASCDTPITDPLYEFGAIDAPHCMECWVAKDYREYVSLWPASAFEHTTVYDATGRATGSITRLTSEGRSFWGMETQADG